jgi:hypothetical protein
VHDLSEFRLPLKIVAQGRDAGPAMRAARVLRELGAETDQSLTTIGRERVSHKRSQASLDSTYGFVSDRRIPPGVLDEYAGLRLATTLLQHNGRRVLRDFARDLTEGMWGDKPASEVIRCGDGRVVARWRSPEERLVLEAILGAALDAYPRSADVVACARELRLLLAPILDQPRRPAVFGDAASAPMTDLNISTRPIRIVDWSPLWAGPYATGVIAAMGAEVTRIEHPARDGLLHTNEGALRWRRWNRMKRLVVVDASTAVGHREVSHILRKADVLVSGFTARVLPQLGFDSAWFTTFAPRLIRIEISAYEPPYSDLPGLGEQAGAIAGLYANGAGEPHDVWPWADPLLGAWIVLVILAALRSRRSPHTLRLSLEAAAARARWIAQ